MDLATIQLINLIIVTTTAAFGLLTIICKPFRNWIMRKKKDDVRLKQDEEDRKETHRCLLRSHITEIYYRHRNECQMHEWEYHNVEKMYTQYKKLGGNSFVDKIWAEIQDWEIDR